MTCPEGCILEPWKTCEHGYRYVQTGPQASHCEETQEAT